LLGGVFVVVPLVEDGPLNVVVVEVTGVLVDAPVVLLPVVLLPVVAPVVGEIVPGVG